LSNQNKNGVNPTTKSTPDVKHGEHKTIQPNKKVDDCKSLKDAMSKFQQLNISAIKNSSNPFFHNSYADLTSVINAANHGAEFGLSFSQAVMYENLLVDDGENKQKVHMSIYVETTVSHSHDEKTLTSIVPVLIKKGKEDDAQAMGSSITYAKRYALQAIMGLASDDDGNAASEEADKKIPPISTKTSNAKSSRGGF
jgi:hypothetical protein